MTLLDVQHVKKSIKHVSKEIRLKPLKISKILVDKGDYVAIMGESNRENQPCSTFLPCLINQQQGVSI